MANNRKDAAARARGRKSAARTEQPPARSIGRMVGFGVFIVVAIVLVVIVAQPPAETIDGVPEGTEIVAVPEALHVDGEIDYDEAVPAGGTHNPIWLNCGVYDAPVREENAVHSLEHGAVWITYNETITGDDVEAVERLGRRARVIVSPVPGQESPVQATSWGRRILLDDPNDIRLEQFATEFTKIEYAPEPGASCSGGVGTPVN